MRELFARYRDTATMAGFLVLLVAFIGTVLVPGYRLANDLSANSAALKLVSEQRGQPEVMMRLLAALRDQLRGGAYVGQSLKDLGVTVTGYDAALTQLGGSAAQQAPEFAEARQLWGALPRAGRPDRRVRRHSLQRLGHRRNAHQRGRPRAARGRAQRAHARSRHRATARPSDGIDRRAARAGRCARGRDAAQAHDHRRGIRLACWSPCCSTSSCSSRVTSAPRARPRARPGTSSAR